VAIFALREFSKTMIADQVTNAILEKIGPDAPESMIRAAKSAGKCFAKEATIPDLVRFGMAKI